MRASGLAAASIMGAATSATSAHCKAPALKKEGDDAKTTKSGSHPKSIPELVLTLGLRERQVFLNGRVDDEMARVRAEVARTDRHAQVRRAARVEQRRQRDRSKRRLARE